MRQFTPEVIHFTKELRTLNLPKSIKAAELLINEMNSDKGFSRHDGSDYFVHPIAVAQTALDFQVISTAIASGDTNLADTILTSCLLHDITEDVDGYAASEIQELFGKEISVIIDNVSKRDNEDKHDYLLRIGSHKVSTLIKVLDRLNNVSTLSNSTHKHRIRQTEETTKIYLPWMNKMKNLYWEYGDVIFQAQSIIESILREVEREIKVREELNSLKYDSGFDELFGRC